MSRPEKDAPSDSTASPSAAAARPRRGPPPRGRKPTISIERIILATSIGVSVGVLAMIVWAGMDYYSAPHLERLFRDDRAIFGTTGTVGLSCGAAAALLFLSNFGYFLRKHIGFLDRVGTLRLWLDWHIASAFLGGAFVILHANFTMRNWIAQTCVYALVIVIVTGLIGRYFLRFVPRSATGQRLDQEGFADAIMELIDQIRADVLHDAEAVRAMQGLVDELEEEHAPPTLGHVRERLAECRRYVAIIDGAMAETEMSSTRIRMRRTETRALHNQLAQLARQAAVIHWAGRLMDAWRAFHRTFALLLLVGMIAHVTISIQYGYGAFWR